MSNRERGPNLTAGPALPVDHVGVYVHVPFCAHICPYCDFNTYAGQEGLISRYVESLERDLARQASRFADRSVGTLFFGGGTPSLLSPDQIAQIVSGSKEWFDVKPDAEVTLEANPNGVDAHYFARLRDAGVNRLSIGVQTLNKRGLRKLGRLHEPMDAQRAVTAARSAGFSNINLDLIFGWPGQTIDDWEAELDQVLAGEVGGQPPEHLSLYSLIIEPGTPFADAVHRGVLTVPDEDETADMYEAAIARLARAGFLHYEVANWASDRDYLAQHNIVYWRNGDYVGVGAGAYAHHAGQRTMRHLLPATYCTAVEQGSSPVSNSETISEETAMGETMMLGLRLLEAGVGISVFARRHGRALDEVYGPVLSEMIALGLMERDAAHVRLTRRGLMVANDVCQRFLPN